MAEIISSSGDFAGKGEATFVAGGSLDETFEYDKQSQYIPISKEIRTDRNKLTYSFPAHSFTQIKIVMKK
jgi:alpha-L-arabinofuranosidase